MAAVPITISGVLCDKYGRTIQPVTIVGEASITGLGVGGGPMPPGEGPPHIWGPPDMPPGFWGGGMGPGVKPQPPAGAHPEHPIVLPPVEPGGPPIDVGAHPEHPIVLPPTPEPPQPVETVTVLKAPPPAGGWGAVSEYGWAYYPAQGAAQPKA